MKTEKKKYNNFPLRLDELNDHLVIASLKKSRELNNYIVGLIKKDLGVK